MRFHTSLPVTDVDATETFYRGLFGSDAVKRKPDYVKFLTPELNISFNLSDRPPATHLHLGFEVESTAALDAIHARLKEAGLIVESRETSVCCYANQDKLWVTDPSGYRWELYVLLEDTEKRIDADTGCCPAPASEEATA